MGKFVQYSDGELLLMLQDGENAAGQEIYLRYWKQLYLFALRILRDRDEAEDIVQDVFLCFCRMEDYTAINNLKSYLFRATRNLVLNRIDRLKVRAFYASSVARAPEPSEYSVDDEFNYQELVRLIERELEALPDEARHVFVMSRFEDKSNKEIESELQLSKDVVKKRISYALKTLRMRLQTIFTLLP